MVGYRAIEKAARDKIRAHFGDLLTENSCVAADLDRLFKEIQMNDRDLGCIIDYADGSRQQGAPYTKQMWQWRIGGFFMVRHRGDPVQTDDAARLVIDKIYSIFEDDHTLGGLTPFVRVESIDQPEAGDLNDIPFYWIYFVIEALDK